MLDVFSRLTKNISGATAIEYALIASLVSVALVSAIDLFAGDLSTVFKNIVGALSAAS